jgi:hypothetical protein
MQEEARLAFRYPLPRLQGASLRTVRTAPFLAQREAEAMTAPSDLIERLRAATMGFDWRDLTDEASIPAVPLLREAADHIASLEAERDDARRQRDDLGRAWDSADARAKEAEAENARLVKALQAAVRAAKLALFVIRKQGVMPNSSWDSGFNSDLATAEAALEAARALSGKGDGE